VLQCQLIQLQTSTMTAFTFQPAVTNLKHKQLHVTSSSVTENGEYSIYSPSPTTDIDEQETISTPLQSQPNAELATLTSGQVLSIRVGDTSLSRKAWKKRRRSNSPILVPCTVLGIEREAMVTSNILNLLYKFGKPFRSQNYMAYGEYSVGGERNGVRLGLATCATLYERTFGSTLLEHAKVLGYSSQSSFFESVFDDYFYSEHGIKLVHPEEEEGFSNNLHPSQQQPYIYTTLSLRRAREAASKPSFVQFISDPSSPEMMFHTGATIPPTITTSKKNYKPIAKRMMRHQTQLSAAIRLSSQNDLGKSASDQEDDDNNSNAEARIQSGMYCQAYVLSYEEVGDNGSPLLVCSIDPPKSYLVASEKRRFGVKRRQEMDETDKVTFDILERRAKNKNAGGGTSAMMKFDDLKVGDGPLKASVVKISASTGAAFVDLGVERKRGKRGGGGNTRVLGTLNLDDIVGSLDCGDIEESPDDVVVMEQVEEGFGDGTTNSYQDEDSSMIDSDVAARWDEVVSDSQDSDNADEEEEDDLFAHLPVEDHLTSIGEIIKEERMVDETSSSDKYNEDENNPQKEISNDTAFMCVGDEIEVYIRGVFPQSGRFMVTIDPAIKGQKLKELKKKREANKRLSRLASKASKSEGDVEEGTSLLSSIDSLIGTECYGTVKAKSKVGTWYYVQPDEELKDGKGCGLKLPVGVAEGERFEEILSPGDRVQIRLDGIDEARGQLAMTLMKSLSS